MLEAPRRRIIRHRQQIRNPNEEALVVVLEPWAERFELATEETIDIVLIGPDTGPGSTTRSRPRESSKRFAGWWPK